MKARRIAEPRRWAAFHCFGIYGLLMDIQASVEDLEGALAAGQIRVAQHAGLTIVRKCLGLRSVLAAGYPPESGDLFIDETAGLTAEQVAEGLTLSGRLVRETELDSVSQAAAAVLRYMRDFERELGFVDKPPSVRRPEGLFPALRLARQVLPINDAAGLPLALPAEWLPQDKSTGEPEVDHGL